MDTARRNRPDIINRLHALIIGMMTTLFVCAQEVTVIVNPVQDVLPPQAGLYITNPGRFFTIQLINNTDEPQFLHFGLQIQQSSPNDLLWVKTDMTTGHIPQSPITLAPNQHKVLNAVEMRHLFDHFTSQDIYLRDDKYLRVTDGNYGLLPEGQFEAFVTAYKWDTSLTTTVPLSNPQQGRCSFNICYEANPPMFTSPVLTDMAVGFDPTKVVMVDKNNPSFEWMPPSLNCNAARVNFQHSIRIVELNSLNIDESMMPGVPTFHEKSNIIGNRYTIPQAYVQQMIEPGKAKGKVYAVQLTASTDYFSSVPGSVNFTLLKNGGKSPIMLFQLFDPNVTEPEIVTVPQKGDGDDDDDGYTLSLDGSDADLDDEDSLYIFEQPLLTQPAFPGKMGRTICIGENINAEWRKAWFAGGKGEEQEKVEFEYTVQLFTGNSADSYADIIEANQVIYEAKTEELKATIKWDDIKEKVSQGSYYILRVTAKPTNEKSVRMLGDSLNYKDFALTTQFNETYQCGKSTANVTNKNSISAKPDQNTKLKIGAWTLSLDRDYEHVEFDKENKTLKGTGWISWTPGSVRARIAVKFDNLKVNTDYVVFEGECNTFAKSSEKVEGADCAVDELLGKFFDKETLDDIYGNLGLSEDLRQKVSQYITGEQSDGDTDGEVNDLAKGYNIGKYYSYYKLADSQISSWTDGNFDFYFPLEVPEEIQQFFPDNFNVQIANMTFSPTSAVMNLIGEIVLPNSDVFDDQAVLVFGAPRLCIQPDRIFPEDGVLSLLSNFPIKDPNSDFKLVFKAPTDPLNPKAKDGCFIRWENDKFGALGLQIAMTLPNTKRVVDGEVKDMPALLDLLAYIEGDDDACDFIAKGTLTPFQINDLPDWTFHIAEQIIFDHHLSDNDDGMPSYETLTSKYPSNTFDPRLCGNYVESNWKAWQGVYIQNLEVEFPKFAVFGSGDKGLKVGAQNMLIDASGVTCQVYSENIFEAQTGSCGGWAFSVKSASVDIIQNNFDNCKFTGGFGVPLFGKKADEQADKEAQSKGVKPNGKKVDDYTDFKYTCEIRHLTDPKEEIYYTWNAEGTKKDVKRTRRTYEKSQYAYLFRTEPVDNLQLNCFLASVDFSNYKAQNYFLVEARDKKEGSGQDTQVELCMAGDITLAGTDNANARLKALAEKIGVEKLKLQLPGIHFIKMRLSNTPYDKWEDYRAGAAEIRDAAKTEQDNKIAEWKTSIFYHNLAKAKEIQLGEGECYFNMGEWSLASERKKIGPFSFNINKFSPKYEKGMLSLDIDGGIGLIEDKICVDGGFTIGAVLHKEGSIQDWYLSDGDVDFKRLELNLDFAAMLKLKGELTLGDNGQGDNGYAGSLDIEIIGLMTINCAGGYFNHVATNADKQEMKKVANEAASNSIGDGGAANALSEGNYSWGYFTANIASGAGIPVGPLSINRISGGFYFNCKPTKGKEATEKTSAGKFSGDPVASYGMIGVAFGIGMSAASGEETIKGDVDLLVVYDRKKSRLSTFMFNGHVEAVGGIINSDVSLIYENSYDESVNPTVGERYLCLNITLNSGFSNSSLAGSIQKANKYLEEMQEDLNRFGENLGNLVDKEVRAGIEQTLDAISGSYDPEKQAEEEAKKTAEDEKKEKEQIYHVGSTGSVRMSLELKITWKDPGKPVYNTPRWHLYLGEPDKQKRCKITFLYFNSKICKVNIGADAYLCLGNELPTLDNGGVLPDIPPTIQEFLSGHKNANTDMGADLSKAQSSRMSAVKSLLNPNNINGGVMVGASAWGKINIDLGLLYGKLEAIAGFDASLINYGNSAFCVNNHSTMGYNGWYATGQLYAYLGAELGMHINLGRLYKGDIVFFTAGIGGVLEMGLPHPTWIEGKARVKISLLNGLCKIDRKFQFSAGDHCVPFKGNALDGFSLFTGVSMGSDSLYQALCRPEFAVSKADVSKMIVTTNASLGSHHRLVDPSYVSDMADQYLGGDNESTREKLKLQAARTYVFDMEKNSTKYGRLGVRLVDLGKGPTDWVKKNPNMSESEFLELCGRVSNYSGKSGSPFTTMLSLVASHYNKKSNTDFEGSRRMSSYSKQNATQREIIGQNNVSSMSWLLSPPTVNGVKLGTSFFCDGKNTFYKAIQDESTIIEKKVNFREDKGQTFHLCDMDVEKGHSYALILSGDAYEIMNGEKSWCHYVDTTSMEPIPMKWKQEKVWFFRVKDDSEDRVNVDELTTLEPYAALAYPSVDGTKVQNRSTEPFVAYFGDIMQPTIALNRDLSTDLSEDKMTWILTAYDASEFAIKDSSDCWKVVQTRLADYQKGYNCVNLHPATAFDRIKNFGNAISTAEAQGRYYDYSNELYHLQLAYYKDGKQKTADKDVRYLVDLWMTSAPHGVTVSGMDKPQDDSWLYTTNREITGELLPYVVPFVGASPQEEPVFSYYNNMKSLSDDDIVLMNKKYNNKVPYRLIDPWLYMAYLSKWTFIGDHSLNAYDFDHVPIPFASESLIYGFNGSLVNSDFVKGVAAKSLLKLRNEMYDTWNTWNWNDSNQPKWPLPSTTKTVGGITAANQNGRASTIAPRPLGITKNDRIYTFAEVFKDFMAPYHVAYNMSITLRDWARDIWENELLPSWSGSEIIDNNLNINMRTWNSTHRGQYIDVSLRGVSARVPFYQLPLIFGGAIGDDNKAKFMNVNVKSMNRGFKKSVNNRQSSDIRFKADVSNILFFRLLGGELTDWFSNDYAPRAFVRSTDATYSDSYLDNGEKPQIGLDLFDVTSALEGMTKFTAYAYRVDSYNLETGFYTLNNRASEPWVDMFSVGQQSTDPKNLGEVDDLISDVEWKMDEYMDRKVPWAIYTRGDKTLTLLYSDKDYSYDEKFNNQTVTTVWRGDNVLNHPWTGDKTIRYEIEHVVIDKSFGAIELTSLESWFRLCENMKTIVGLQILNTNSVKSMASMFSGCKKLEEVDLSSMNTSSLEYMGNMFSGCEMLKKVNFTRFKTNNVASIGGLFKDCSSLTSLDLSSFSGENIASCSQMFYGCSKLTMLNISNFDADEKVGKYYKEMFVNVPNTLVSYIDVNLKEEIKDQIPGRKNEDNTAAKAIVAKNKDGKHVLIFLISNDSKLKVGYKGNIETAFAVYEGLTIKKIFEGDKVMNTGNTIPEWAGDKDIVKVIFDQSFKSSFTSMYGWFSGCENLTTIECNRKLRTNKLTTMARLFYGCENLESAHFITNFNIEKVQDMSYMFYNCKKMKKINLMNVCGFDNPTWFDTGNVTNMSHMFQGCENMKEFKMSEHFNLGKVKDMSYMFSGCKALEYIDWDHWLSDLDKSDQLTNASYMFDGCESLKDAGYFDYFIKMINTSNATNMSYMFRNCKSLTEINISHFSTEKLTNTSNMFYGCSGLKRLDMSIFTASRVTSLDGMFSGVPNDCVIYLPYNTNSRIHPAQVKKETHPNLVLLYPTSVLLLRPSDTSNTELVCLNTDTKYTAGETYNGKEIIQVWSGRQVYTSSPWSSYQEKKNVVKVTFTPGFQYVRPVDMSEWFYGMENLETIEGMEYLNTSEATNMSRMFCICKSLKTLDLSHFDTSNVEEMQGMFYGCSSLEELDLSSFNTSNVKTMGSMFSGCSQLKHLDLSSFDTRNVAVMYSMFSGCKSLNDLNLSSFDVSNAGIEYMFNGCESLSSLNLGSFVTSEKPMGSMFENCISLRSLTVGYGFAANEKSENTFQNVSKLKVYVPDYNLDKIREEFTTNLGFVEGVTGKFLVIGEEEVLEDIAQVVWTESNSTLTFCYMPEIQIGEIFGGAKVTQVWSGEDVTNSPQDRDPKWGAVKPKKVLIDESFQKVKPKSMAYWFACGDVSNSITQIINLEYVNTSEVESMRYTFFYVKQDLAHIDFSKLDISKVKDISGMLPYVPLRGFLDLSTLDTRNVEKADYLFQQYHRAHVKVGPNFTFDKMTKKAIKAFIRSGDAKVNDLYVEVVGSSGTAVTYAQLEKVKKAFTNKLGWVVENGRIKATSSDYPQAVWCAGNKTLYFLKAPLFKAGIESLHGSVVTEVWYGDKVLNSGGNAAWTSTVKETVEYVDFEESFATVTPTSLSSWFSGCKNLWGIEGLDKNLNTSKVTNMSRMFCDCSSYRSLTGSQFKNFNTENVTNMSWMFYNCTSVKKLNLSSFNVDAVTDVYAMFGNCSSLEEIIGMPMPGADNKVNMSQLFKGCEKLKALPSGFINNWHHLQNATQVIEMFKNCKSLESLPTRSDGTVLLSLNNATSLNSMFENCTSLTFGEEGKLEIRGISNIKNMSKMFKGCTSLKTLDFYSGSAYITSQLTNMTEMFSGCTKLKKLYFSSDLFKNTDLQGTNVFESVTRCYVYITNAYFSFDSAKDKLVNKCGFGLGDGPGRNGWIIKKQ